MNFNEHLAAPFAGIIKGTRQTLSLSVSIELLDRAAGGAWDSYTTNQVQLTLAASCTDRVTVNVSGEEKKIIATRDKSIQNLRQIVILSTILQLSFAGIFRNVTFILQKTAMETQPVAVVRLDSRLDSQA